MMPFAAMRLRNRPVVGGYAALVLASSPAQYLRFGETSGTSAVDASGNGRNGVYTRDASNTTGAGLITGDSNTAFVGPASTSSPVSGITYPGCAAPAGVDFTVTMLIKPSGVPPSSGFGGLLQLGANGVAVPELGILDQGGGLFKIRVARSGVATIYSSSTSWAYGTRLHVKLSRNGSTIVLRVNGVQEGTASMSFDSQTSTTNIGLNNTGSGAGFQFAGTIDEFAAWPSFIADSTTDAMYAAM